MSEDIQEKTIQLLLFQIGKENYAIHIEKTQEIIRMQEITPLPKTPKFIKGVINLRGHIIPVVDMHERLGITGQDYKNARIIIVKIQGKLVGMVVSSVSEVVNLSVEDLEEPPELIAGLSREYIEAIGKMGELMIVIVKIDKLLTEKEQDEINSIYEEK